MRTLARGTAADRDSGSPRAQPTTPTDPASLAARLDDADLARWMHALSAEQLRRATGRRGHGDADAPSPSDLAAPQEPRP